MIYQAYRRLAPWLFVVLLSVAFYPQLSVGLEGVSRSLRASLSGLAGQASMPSARSMTIATIVIAALATGAAIKYAGTRWPRALGALALIGAALGALAAAISMTKGTSVENVAGLAGSVVAAGEGFGSIYGKKPAGN